MSYNKRPNLGQATMANSEPVVIASDQSAVPVSATNLDIRDLTATDVVTANLSATDNAVLDAIEVATEASQASLSSIEIDTSSILNAVDGIEALQTTANGLLTDIETAVDGLETSTASINTKTPALGQATKAASTPVVIASDQDALNVQEQALMVTGQAAQTATVNNILTTTSGTAATDLQNYRTATVQVVSTGTAGTFIFEQSNDNVNFIALPVFNAALVTGVPITAAITATSSQIIYSFPVRARYVRLRIATTITGGSIQAFSRFSTEPWTAAAQLVASNTAANFLATVSATNLSTNIAQMNGVATSMGNGVSGTGVQRITLASDSTGTLGNFIPTAVADVASAAIATTTTTAAFTPTAGSGYQVVIPVTVVSGTTPTLSVRIEESDDAGTNWYARYTFPTITATGIYRSPILRLRGNRVRYVQTITGTTPSFTRAINRNQRQDNIFSGWQGKLVSAASTNATSVLAAPCEVLKLTASNTNASARYLKVYDKASAPTVGTDTPVATYTIPGNATGAGTNIPLTLPDSFQLGFAFAITTGAADSDTGAVSANENIINYTVG
jgi:hypothetical protein